MPSMSVWFVARAAHSTRSATVPVPASSATVTPVARAIATSSGIFAVRCPEMTRDKVGCEMPVMSASARWLRPAAARARSILTPTPVVFTATSQQAESQSASVIHGYAETSDATTQAASLILWHLADPVAFGRPERFGAPILSSVSTYRNPAGPAGAVRPGRQGRRASAHRRPTSLLQQIGLASLAGGRSRALVHELAKFGIIGVLAVLVADIGTNVLHFQTGMGPLSSNVIATVVSTIVSYLGNRYWTFRDRQRTTVSREGVMFFVLNGVGLAIQLACLGFSTYMLHLHGKLSYNIFLVIGIGLATVFRYVAYKKWVWRVQPSPPAAAAQPRSEPVLG